MRSNKQKARRGIGDPRTSCLPSFTLVEIMIVVVIIGLMAGLVTYATTGYLERAKRQRARSDLATYSGAVDAITWPTAPIPEQSGPESTGARVHQGAAERSLGQAISICQPGKTARTTSSATAPTAAKAEPAPMRTSPIPTRK